MSHSAPGGPADTKRLAGVPSVSLLREFSIPLILGVVAGIVWANVHLGSYQSFVYSPLFGPLNVKFLVNEVFMAIFFGIAAVEITDSLVPGGSLNPPSRAMPALLATIGGVVGPAAVYLLLNMLMGDESLTRGWGIGTATDIALAWLVARMVFGAGRPAISFLLLIAIADDAIGLVIIAVFYPDPSHPVAFLPLLVVQLGMLAAFALRCLRVKSYGPYMLLGGGLSWAGLFLAHLHPALALVFIVPFMPHQRQARQESAFDVPPQPSVLAAFEHEWKVVVDFGLLFFGLANAGVPFAAVGTATWLVFLSLLVGKTVGIFGGGMFAKMLGLALPNGISIRDLFLISMIGGIGLTVALFVAGAAFTDPATLGAAKMGALASAAIGPLVFVVARVWKSHRSHPNGGA